jgi:pyruvate-formate lyase
VNVLNQETLLKAIEQPELYPNLVVRISGYATRFNALTEEQKQDIVTRTFHKQM